MNFLQGTYGFDMLSIFLILLSAIFNIWNPTKLIGLLLIAIVFYRAFSKNIYKRRGELSKFISYANALLSKFGKKLPNTLPELNLNGLLLAFQQIKFYINQKSQFKIIKCPSCKQKLRLPRKKGKIVVTCRKCSTKFDSRT